MPQYDFVMKCQINKDWSRDKKYCVTDEQGNKFLLLEQYERKKTGYELMKQVAARGIPMCKPLAFDAFDEEIYIIQTWIDGVDANEVIQDLTSEEQYLYGAEAGKVLKEIHKVPAPEGAEGWASYMIVK